MVDKKQKTINFDSHIYNLRYRFVQKEGIESISQVRLLALQNYCFTVFLKVFFTFNYIMSHSCHESRNLTYFYYASV